MTNLFTTQLNATQLQAVLTELCGGPETLTMLTLYHAELPEDRLSLRQLARRFGFSFSTVRRRTSLARARLRRCGLLPPAWEKAPVAPQSARAAVGFIPAHVDIDSHEPARGLLPNPLAREA